MSTNEIEIQTPLLKLVLVPIDSLVYTDSKSRKPCNEEELIALSESIKARPELLRADCIVVNRNAGRKNIIISGNKRIEAIRKYLKWEKVPVFFVDVDEIEELAVAKIFNNHAGEDDPEGLASDLKKLHSAKFNLNTIGFSPKKLNEKMGDFGKLATNFKNDADSAKGTTPAKKAKATAGMRIQCPNCDSCFTFVQDYVVQTVE
jgi:ParB-like chromosome segregation protein Spo0J